VGAPLKWFPYYVDDIETDEKFDRLTLEEQGAYHLLLRWQWREGNISSRTADVARRLIVRSASAELSQSKRTAIAKRLLRLFFVPDEGHPGRSVNPRLAQLYVEQVGKSEKARAAAMLSHQSRRANGQRSHGVR
jgi:uncharacterized protein YdaU (DUF1376 family)